MRGSRRGGGSGDPHHPAKFNFLKLHNKITQKYASDPPSNWQYQITVGPLPLGKKKIPDPRMCISS